MKLNMLERRLLLELLPEKSDYAGMKEVRRTRESCSFTQDEIKKYGTLKEGTETDYIIAPNVMVATIKEVPLGEWITETIRAKLRQMDEKKQLEERFMSLFEKFIVNYQQY